MSDVKSKAFFTDNLFSAPWTEAVLNMSQKPFTTVFSRLEPARKGRDQERGKCAGKDGGRKEKRWKKRLDIMLNV